MGRGVRTSVQEDVQAWKPDWLGRRRATAVEGGARPVSRHAPLILVEAAVEISSGMPV